MTKPSRRVPHPVPMADLVPEPLRRAAHRLVRVMFLPPELLVPRDGGGSAHVDRAVSDLAWRRAAESGLPLVTRWTGEPGVRRVLPGHVPAAASPPQQLLAAMLRALDLRADRITRVRMIVIGAGDGGWASALLAHLLGSRAATTTERRPATAAEADRRLGLTARVGCADGLAVTRGGPWERILITHGVREIPHALARQLAPHGVLVAPSPPPTRPHKPSCDSPDPRGALRRFRTPCTAPGHARTPHIPYAEIAEVVLPARGLRPARHPCATPGCRSSSPARAASPGRSGASACAGAARRTGRAVTARHRQAPAPPRGRDAGERGRSRTPVVPFAPLALPLTARAGAPCAVLSRRRAPRPPALRKSDEPQS